ncbi:MAG: ATP-binding protein [Rhodocyclaceae bacterium]|nr:ATP-binding protein [Rhodocyclaceae bacterium]
MSLSFRKTGWFLIPVLLLLAVFAGWMSESTTRHALQHSRDVLSVFITEDIRLREGVLRTRYGIDHNYDAINRNLATLQKILTELQQTAASSSIAPDVEKLARSLAEDEALLDQFRYLVAVTRNSLRYYVHGTHQLAEALPDNRATRKLQHETEDSAIAILQLSAGESTIVPEDLPNIQLFLVRSIAQLGAGRGADFARLPDHARIVFEGVPKLNDITHRLTNSATRTHLVQLDAAIHTAIDQESLRQWQRGMISVGILSVLLVIFGVIAARQYRRAQVALAEEKRQERWSRFQGAALSATANAVVITDPTGIILWVNPAFTQLTGYTTEEVVEKNPRDILKSGQHEEAFYTQMWHELVAGRVWHGEIVNRYKDGGLHHEDQTIAPVLDETGEVQGFIAVKVDISERVETQRTLIAAREAALDANRAKSEFLANISHEIRTPMNGVLGMLQLLQMTPLNDEQSDYLGTIEESAQSLMTIITDILDFSKIESHRIEIETIYFSLHECENNLQAAFAARAEKQGLAFHLTVGDTVPDKVMGDAKRLKQILNNYFSNALKFTKTGGITLVVEKREGTRIRFLVRDTGIGIPADRQCKLFQPFVQADGSSTRQYGGTGLGLAINQQLAHLMGGEVGFESAPGKGSTFWVEIPLPTC